MRNNRNKENRVSVENKLEVEDNIKDRVKQISKQHPIKFIKVMQTKFIDYLNELNSSIQCLQRDKLKIKKVNKQKHDSIDNSSISIQKRSCKCSDNHQIIPKEKNQTTKKQRNSKLQVNFIKKQIQIYQKQQQQKTAKIILQDGSVLEGQVKNGEILSGKMFFADGNIYQGGFKDFKLNGKGILTLVNGTCYRGTFLNGKLFKQGEITYNNGERYIGHIQDYRKHGQGELNFQDGKKYIGNFYKGEITGFGTYYIGNMQINGLWGKGQLLQRFNGNSPCIISQIIKQNL